MTTRNCSEPGMSLMEKENGKSSSLKLQSRGNLYCHVAAASIWCPSSRGLSVSVGSRASLRSLYLAREIRIKESNVLILYPIFFHGQDWAISAFQQPPVSNSVHPRAPRKPNSPQHSTQGWWGTSQSLSCTKISFFSRGLSKVSHITNWADR